MEKVDLKLITSYWCNEVSPEWETRFLDAFEKIDIDGVSKIGKSARVILQSLALSYTDERAASSLAVGPLENYVNVIVKENDSNEAAYIVEHPILGRLLPYVWGKAGDLMHLARKGKVVSKIPTIGTGLQVLDWREATCFWCKLASSKRIATYDQFYEVVMEKLRKKSTRPKITEDLLLCAPDQKAEKYLKEEVLAWL